MQLVRGRGRTPKSAASLPARETCAPAVRYGWGRNPAGLPP